MKMGMKGNEKDVNDETSLFDLLKQSKMKNGKPGVAVAINNDVISHPEWENIKLKQNDRIEFIRAVQGG